MQTTVNSRAGCLCSLMPSAPANGFLKPLDRALCRSGFNHWVILLFLVATAIASGETNGFRSRSAWDENLLNLELHNVHIQPETARPMGWVWEGMVGKYLTRANLYDDNVSDTNVGTFSFDKETTTVRELFDAFLATYPGYMYTEDPETGVIWFHPKRIKYEEILSQKVRIDHPIEQIPAFKLIMPVCTAFGITTTEAAALGTPIYYFIDVPSGVYSVREILNFCCLADPSRAFSIFGREKAKVLSSLVLYYPNPFSSPRTGAVSFWEIEVGKSKSSDGIPSAAEVSAALGDTDPRKRWAARCYFEAAQVNYARQDILYKNDNPENAVWVALGMGTADSRSMIDPRFLVANVAPGFTTNLYRVRSPCLALITSLELTREKQDTSYLDSIINQHRYSDAEAASVKSDVYRLFNESQLVRDKLESLKVGVPEFSPETLREMGDLVDLYDIVGTNRFSPESVREFRETKLFTVVPAENK